MSNRITGLATGLEIDKIVEQTMQAYKTKVDVKKQQKGILEIKQQLYRDVIKDGQEFYNKYFDLTKDGNLLMSNTYQSIKFTSSNEEVVSASSSSTAVKDNYTVDVKSLAKSASTTLTDAELKNDMEFVNDAGKSVVIKASELNGKNEKEIANYINSKISSIGLKASTSDFSSGITVETSATGSDKIFTIKSGNGNERKLNGTDLKAIITNSKGTIAYGYAVGDADIPAGAKVMESKSNQITLDGVNFTINNVGKSNVIGKVDPTELKDKIVAFVDDYNKLITKMNTLLNETKYRDYKPLTDDQKKEMSEKEIELWDKKVKSGQLRRDSDLTRIADHLKSAISSSVIGAGGVLKNFGIDLVKDNSGSKQGTFTIDENALMKAIEKNPEELMNIFTKKGSTDADTGIMYRMKDILNDEFVSTTKSALMRKAGFEGTASFTQNTLSTEITKYEKKISEMEDDLDRREQLLFSKWSKIETMMNNYNSQSSYLSSMFSTN